MSDPAADPWAWVPDSWRDAGEQMADRLAQTAQSAGQTLGMVPTPDEAAALAAQNQPGDPNHILAAPAPPDENGNPLPLPPSIGFGIGNPAVPPPEQAQAVTGAPAVAPMPAVPMPANEIGAPAAIPMPTSSADNYGQAPATPATVGDKGVSAKRVPQTYEEYLGTLSDEQLLKEKADREAAQETFSSAAKLREAHEQQLQAKQNYETYQRAQQIAAQRQAEIYQQADALMKRKIDPDTRSTFSKIRGVVAAFVGGLAAPSMGGRNVGLEAVQREIDQSIDAQKADIANSWRGLEMKKGAVAEAYQQSGNLYHAAEAARLAMWQGAINEIDSQQAAFDPKGSTFMKYEIMKRQAQAVQGAAAQKVQQETLKTAIEEQRKERELQDKIRHEQAEEKNAQATTGVAYGRLALDKKQFDIENTPMQPDQIKALYGIDVPHPMTNKQLSAVLGTKKELGELDKAQAEATTTEAATTVRNPVTGDVLTNAKGKAIHASEKQATEAQDILVRSQSFIDKLASARRMLADDPSLVDRAQWATVKSDINGATMDLIKFYEGNPSSREMQAMEHVMPADFDSISSRVTDRKKGIAQIDHLIDTMQRDVGTVLRGKVPGYDGKPVLLDSSKVAKPEATENDTLQENINRPQNPAITRSVGTALSAIAPWNIPKTIQDFDRMSPEDKLFYGAKNAPALSRIPGYGMVQDIKDIAAKQAENGNDRLQRALTYNVLPSSVEAMDRLKLKAQHGDKASLEVLSDAANSAEDEGIAKLASDAINSIGQQLDSPRETAK